jgi:hypothetical protein
VSDESGQLTHFVSNSVGITARRARRSELQNQNVVLIELSDRRAERTQELFEANLGPAR